LLIFESRADGFNQILKVKPALELSMVASPVQAPELPESTTKRFEALIHATSAIAACREDGGAILKRWADELRKFITFDYVVINVVDPDSGETRWKAFQAFETDEDLELPAFRSNETPSGLAFTTQKPVVIRDWEQETRYPKLREYLRQYGVMSTCILPLTTAQSRVGTLAIGKTSPHTYGEEEVRFLTLVANHVALAIDSALSLESSRRARAELEVKKDRLQLVLDLTNRLVSNLELSDLLLEVSGTVRRVMRCDAAGVALPDADKQHLRFFALDFPEGKGFLTQETLIPMTSPVGIAYLSNEVQLRSRSQIQMDCPEACSSPAIREGLNSGCFLPLKSRGQVLGVLALSRFADAEFSADEIEFLEQIANQIAIAVANAIAYGQIAELKEKLSQEKLYLEDEIRGEFDFDGIIGQSNGLRHVLQLVETVAQSDSTVLLLGETGTGKELIARAIHDRSRRKQRTFVKTNCAAIPTGLLESELFGHEKGAFTGAVTQKLGRLELADRGTLFLDEVGDIPLELQPKLLRALQEREFERLGSIQTKKVDVRLIAATNRNLENMINDREFRSDLYYRLNVFPIRIPPLRERPDDIPLLVRYFTQKYSRRMEKQIDAVTSAAIKKLSEWHWPGNIRELENFIERAVILTRGHSLEIPVGELHSNATPPPPLPKNTFDEREQIVNALLQTKGRVGGAAGAAARLGLKRTTLISRMKKLGIESSERVS
jgi:formate hydrogenlyase transcriptional activator